MIVWSDLVVSIDIMRVLKQGKVLNSQREKKISLVFVTPPGIGF